MSRAKNDPNLSAKIKTSLHCLLETVYMRGQLTQNYR